MSVETSTGDEDQVDYGPLRGLIGTWEGDSGMDISPESDGTEENPFFETIGFRAGGDVTNAERQKLAIVRYHQVVQRKSNGEVFHDQVGYWLWDPSAGTVTQTLTIPRGVSLVASGAATEADGSWIVEVDCGREGIAQTAFMAERASTVGYRHRFEIAGDVLRYRQTTVLDIYGRSGFDHTDENVLRRVASS